MNRSIFRKANFTLATAKTHRIAYRTHLIGAITVAALIVGARMATAQPSDAQIRTGLDDAIQALDKSPRLKEMPPHKKKRLVEFIIGNTIFVMAHEMGHGLINEMNMPVLGREEDAADSFAVVTAMKLGPKFSERVLHEATMGWVLSSKEDWKEKNPIAYYDEHGLDLQRAYNVVCFMFGSNPEKYKALAAHTKLPEYRQQACPYEWQNTSWSWDETLKKHLRSADQPKIAVKVAYQENEKYEAQARVMRHMGLLEAFAEHMADRYAWPNPWTIEARSCDEPNARWRQRNLTVCYELAHYFTELFLSYSETWPRAQEQ
jgi:hypothetical protein